MKKIFGGMAMTWRRVILAAVCAGVVTALAAMFIPEGNSFRQIAVMPEAWVLFAILIIVNCEKPLEAAEKTFVFFLISQPLVYLIQVPFNSLGWHLFSFYRYWFLVTLLTFPGAYIGWFIKKDNLLSGLILSVMLVLLAVLGLGYARDLLRQFPHFLVGALFCFAQIPLYIIFILRNKNAKIAACVITVAAIAVGLFSNAGEAKFEQITAVDIDDARYPVDESWTVRAEDESISTAELFEMEEGDYYLRLHLYKTEENTVTLVDGEGREYAFRAAYVENEGLSFDEKR